MLKTLDIENFTVFKEAHLNFSSGLNVIVGENGTGKSHLLKLGYATLRTLAEFGDKEPAKEVAERAFAKNLLSFFRPDSLGRLASRVQGASTAEVKATWGKKGTVGYNFSTRHSEKVVLGFPDLQFEPLPASCLFIPPKEILSIYPGFQRALENRELAFDDTYLDLSRALNGASLKGRHPDWTTSLVEKIEDMLHASIIKKDNKFYFNHKLNNGSYEAHLVAEGHRKIGMIAYLILNGELKKNSSLFWDEPEANLNPKMLVNLAELLVELSSLMQINIATHSLFLLKELEILYRKKRIDSINYFALVVDRLNEENPQIVINSGKSADEIGDIAALDANIEQSDRFMNLIYQE